MKLTLLRDSPLNTELANPEGQVVYWVNTPFGFTSTTTTICHILPKHDLQKHGPTDEMTVLAQLHWRLFGSAKLNYNGMEIDMLDFLYRKSFFSRGRRFIAADGRSYKWVTVRTNVLCLELDDDSKTIIARSHKVIFGKASLEIAPAGEHIVDQIVITFLYLYALHRQDEDRRRRAMLSSSGIA